MRKQKGYFMHALLPLIFGTIGYYLFCPNVFFVIKADEILPFSLHFVTNLQRYTFAKLFRNYGFDFLWAYSFFFVLHIFLGSANSKAHVIITLIFAMLYAILMEFLQIFLSIPGTFDYMDLIVEGCALVFAAGVITIFYGGEESEKAQ